MSSSLSHISNVSRINFTDPEIVMGRYTENTEPIYDIFKNDTDTDVGI